MCDFCNKDYTQSNHKVFCKENPNKKIRKTSNQFLKAKENGKEVVISAETRQKFSKTGIGRKHTEESLAKIRKGMQKAVLEHPESYAGGYNRGRVKSIICSNGFNVLGSWEQTFVEFCLSNHIEIQQPNTGFSYIWKGTRTYFPDFYLPESDQWIEVKGLETDRDGAKWDSLRNTHGKKLKVIDKNLIHNLSVEIICS